MTSTGFLLISLVFSSLGMGYFIYGKRQGKPSALLGGIALMVYPYFIKSMVVLIGLGAVLCAVPFFVGF